VDFLQFPNLCKLLQIVGLFIYDIDNFHDNYLSDNYRSMIIIVSLIIIV